MGPIAALFGFTIRQALISRKIWLTLLILAAPSGLMLLIRTFDTPAPNAKDLWEMYQVSAHLLLMSVLVPLVCMVHGTALIAADAEARTITYLITRRMRRATVLLVKFVATVFVLAVLADLGMISLHFCAIAVRDVPSPVGDAYFATWNPAIDLWYYLALMPIAVLAFLALFTLIGLLTARPLAVSVFYLIAVELILSNLPIRARIYSLAHQLRVTAARFMPRLADIYELPRELREELYVQPGSALPRLIAVIVVALVVAALLMTVRELIPTRVSRE